MEYKGYRIKKDRGLYRVVLKNHREFILALDDSKLSGKRQINEDKNTIKECKNFIDLITKEERSWL